MAQVPHRGWKAVSYCADLAFEEAARPRAQPSLEARSISVRMVSRLCSAVVGLHMSGTAVSVQMCAIRSRVSTLAPSYAGTAGDARAWHQHARHRT